MRAKFGVLEQTHSLHLPAKFHLNVFVVLASGGQKPQFWTNFDIFGGSCIDSLLPMRAKFGVLQHTRGLRLCAKFRLDRFILSPSGGKKPNFCHILPYFGLRHLVVSPIGSSLRKLNSGAHCTTTNLPLSNGIKIVSVLQRLHGEIGRTISDVQKRDEETDRQQTKKTQRFWLPRAAGEIRTPPNLAW